MALEEATMRPMSDMAEMAALVVEIQALQMAAVILVGLAAAAMVVHLLAGTFTMQQASK